MRNYFFMGLNSRNKAGAAFKIWRIARESSAVTTWWGAATLVQRRVVPANTLQSKTVRFRSEEAAKAHEKRRIDSKIAKGYERRPAQSR